MVAVEMTGCLHLKSAVTQVAEDTLLINRDWVDVAPFAGLELIDVHPTEPGAANALWLKAGIIYPTTYPQTQARLTAQGIPVQTVNVSELIKAEGAVTCCSLIVL